MPNVTGQTRARGEHAGTFLHDAPASNHSAVVVREAATSGNAAALDVASQNPSAPAVRVSAPGQYVMDIRDGQGNQLFGVGTAGITGSAQELTGGKTDLISPFWAGGAASPGYSAHRGGGDVRPEHTLEAYKGARAEDTSSAVEVSVQRTADGSLVCMHDTTLDRTTTGTGTLSTKALADLRTNYAVRMRTWLGPNWPDQPIPLAADALDALAGRKVVFIEPKNGNAAEVQALLALLGQYPNSRNWAIWKTYRGAGGASSYSATQAKAAGYKLWIYGDAADTDATYANIATYADYIGVPVAATDAKIQAVVALGKPVMMWEVRRRSERDRFTALGVSGIMCTVPSYVNSAAARFATDQFATGLRAPGDHPYADTLASMWTWDVPNQAIEFASSQTRGIVLGSMASATPPASYTLQYQMRWNTLPTVLTTHADCFFGHSADTGFQFNTLGNLPGYHVILRGNGQLGLYTHVPGSTAGTQLGGTIATAAPVAGQWITIRIQVTPTQVIVQRVDDASAAITQNDTQYRGGYFGLTPASSDVAVQFRGVSLT